MFEKCKRDRAARRVTAGDGRALQRYRWWQLPGRALFHLCGTDANYAVDVRHWQNQSGGGVKADLYRNGRHWAASKLPAAFPVDGGTIEVAMSGFGVKRCHLRSTFPCGRTSHWVLPRPSPAPNAPSACATTGCSTAPPTETKGHTDETLSNHDDPDPLRHGARRLLSNLDSG